MLQDLLLNYRNPTFKMKYSKISCRDRKRIYEAFKEEKDGKQVVRTLGINIRTAYHWLQMNKTLPMKKGGSPTKKTSEILETLKTSIEENSSLTLAQASDIIFSRFNLRVYNNTIRI